MKTWEEAHNIEIVEKAQCQVPPSIKHRATAYWNPVNHRIHNADTLKWMDLAEAERKERYKNKYIMDNNLHARDVREDQVVNERRLNRIEHERFAEPLRRGYDIVNNQGFGPTEKPPYLPYCMPQPDVWERACRRTASVPPGGEAHSSASPRIAKTPPPAPTPDAPKRSSTPQEIPKRSTTPKSGAPASGRPIPPPGHTGRVTPPAPSATSGTRPPPAASVRSGSVRSAARQQSPAARQQSPPVPQLNLCGGAPPAPLLKGGHDSMAYSKPVKA